MKIEINENEARAILILKDRLNHASTPWPELLRFIKDRMVYVHGDMADTDFIVALDNMATKLDDIIVLLNKE